MNATDPTGMWIEDLVIGVPSAAIGIWSAGSNALQGNWGAAGVDAAGVVADVAAIATPGIPGGAGLGIQAGRRGIQAANAAGDARTVSNATDAGRGADFIVTPDGAAMRPSAADNVADMRGAGLPERPASTTGESGTIFTAPNNGNPMDVRVMEGGSGAPPRAVTSRAGTNDPLLPSGQQFPNGTPRQVRRDQSHVELEP